MRFADRVQTVFWITGRGLILVPENPGGNYRLRLGDLLQLRTPDGRSVDTRMASIEMVCGPNGCRLAIALPGDIGKDEISIGTEIWYVPENTEQAVIDTPAVPGS